MFSTALLMNCFLILSLSFFVQIKLVDVEKVEWLNRRSYSAISLFLGREGRVLLRTDNGLEDWFELLEVWDANLHENHLKLSTSIVT